MKKKYHIPALPRMFEQVTKQIVDYIVSENLEPGSKLPTERNLSELLQVSRSSIREGIRVLELLRFLDSRQGEGTFVATPSPFLIPYHVIRESVSPEQLDHYFEIFLMCTEKVIWLAVEQKLSIPLPKTDPTSSFWEELGMLVETLGKQIDNPYYLSLWSDTFDMLLEHDYFIEKAPIFSMDKLNNAMTARDFDRLKYLFTSFTE